MLGILEQSTGAQVNIVTDNEANLKIVLRMWTSDLGISICRPSLLEFEDPVQFPGTLLEQARRNDETVKLVFFILVSVGFGL